MLLNLLQWFLSPQTCGYGLDTTANVTVASKAYGHFSSQTNSDKLVCTSVASPRHKSYARIVSPDYECNKEEKSWCYITIVHYL